MELPKSLNGTSVYRWFSGFALSLLMVAAGVIWNGQADKGERTEKAVGRVGEAVESVARVLGDVRLDVATIKGELSRLKTVDDSFQSRMDRLERAYDRDRRTRGLDPP